MKDTIFLSHEYISEPKPKMVRVWDPLVRIFHWSLAASFMIAFLTEDDLLVVHVWAGYTIFGLILLRLVWGFDLARYRRTPC